MTSIDPLSQRPTMPGSTGPAPTRPPLVRSGLLVMGAFLVSKVVGLLRDRAIASRFGAGVELDAYIAAFKIPDLLFTLFAGGALISAFIPVFAEALTRSDTADRPPSGALAEDPWRLSAAVTTWVALATFVLAAAAALWAGPLTDRVVAPSFTPAQQALAADLMRTILLSTLIFAFSGIQMGILQAHQHFLTPALAPILYNLGIWAGALWLAPRLGIHGLAWGVVLGAIGHLVIKLPALWRRGWRYRPTLAWGDPTLRLVLLLMLPRMLALGTVRLMDLINARFSSALPAGSLSSFNYAWLISQMPQTLLGTAIATVAFPTLALLAARGDLAGLRSLANRALSIMIALTVPSAAGLWILGGPAIDLLLRTGRFDEGAAAMTLGALRMFSLGLLGHVTLEIIARIFYARKDTWTPLWMAVGALAANLALAWLWVGPLAHRGLALANSAAITAEVLLGLALLARGLGGLGLGHLASQLARSLAAAAVMALALRWAVDGRAAGVLAEVLGGWGPLAARPALAGGLARLGLGVVVGGATYLAAALALGVEGTRMGWARVRERVRR